MTNDFPLRFRTSPAWVQCVMNDFDTFLLDHAAAEKKASGMAISMISHYPDRTELVDEMADLAVEELVHYKEVIKVIHQRGLTLGADEKDAYVNAFRKHIRKGSEAYFLDRLLCGAIIEARGAERFGLIADALEPGQLKQMYKAIASSEKRHFTLFCELAELYFPHDVVQARLDTLLDAEAEITASLPIQPKLH
ncbi:Uncharacterised protein [BD1-7 clade bacterium]|uniref:tRNA-(Ms[2]io[6]A)-hydroxylase n=1 Tax=BD1-7 clade bacterium TaxID=2029982 RepID=A0A5S9N1G9_9GAMM|nr:Uncharacterised protein [BD1-7 clade bacterium]